VDLPYARYVNTGHRFIQDKDRRIVDNPVSILLRKNQNGNYEASSRYISESPSVHSTQLETPAFHQELSEDS
jgi:hypothetical protein